MTNLPSDCWVCDDNPTICRCPLYGPEFNVKPPTIGSLFSGYGGLDMAVEAVTGATPAWFCEWDDAPSKVLAHRWPHVPNFRDVTTVDWKSVPRVDILTGGYPCQPFSHAGRREGTNDDRHLWPHVREAIRVLRPRITILENVAGHRSLGFDRVLGDLAEDGADVWWTSLRASDIGAPHHRERLFIIATPSDAAGESGWVGDGDSQPAPDPEGSRRDHGTAAHIGTTNREKHAPGHDSDPAADTCGTAIGEFTGGSSAEETGPEAGDGSVDPGGKRPAENGRGACAPDTGRLGLYAGGHPESGQAQQPRTDDCECALPDTGGEERARGTGLCQGGEEEEWGRRPGNGHNAAVEWGAYAPAVRRWERLTRPAPAPTELNRNGKPRLNAAFAEWMMGLPAGHVTGVPGLSRADQLKMIGNGVVPQQAAAAIRGLFNRTTEVGEQFTLPI